KLSESLSDRSWQRQAGRRAQLGSRVTPLYHTSIADIPRFWAPLGHEVQTDSRGFLRSPVFDPDRFELTPDSNLVPTTSLVNVPGLILLGTPGSGKSVELERLREASDASTPTLS